MKANEFITNIAEISIKYNYKVKAKDRVKAADSNKLAEAFFSVFDKDNIEVQETAYCAILDRNFGIIGIIKIGEGNDGTTIMNMDKAYQAAILCNGHGIALCHNHPSGNLKPSSDDKRLTNQFKCSFHVCDVFAYLQSLPNSQEKRRYLEMHELEKCASSRRHLSRLSKTSRKTGNQNR